MPKIKFTNNYETATVIKNLKKFTRVSPIKLTKMRQSVDQTSELFYREMKLSKSTATITPINENYRDDKANKQ